MTSTTSATRPRSLVTSHPAPTSTSAQPTSCYAASPPTSSQSACARSGSSTTRPSHLVATCTASSALETNGAPDGQIRAEVERWLANHEDAIAAAARALLVETDAQHGHTVDSLMRFAQTELLPWIDDVLATAVPHEASEALAEAGVLPMFGFPTQVRTLYLERPKPFREANDLDRDAAIALGEFAPGREMVKDKSIHIAVGVVDYYQRARRHMGRRRQASRA